MIFLCFLVSRKAFLMKLILFLVFSVFAAYCYKVYGLKVDRPTVLLLFCSELWFRQ